MWEPSAPAHDECWGGNGCVITGTLECKPQKCESTWTEHKHSKIFTPTNSGFTLHVLLGMCVFQLNCCLHPLRDSCCWSGQNDWIFIIATLTNPQYRCFNGLLPTTPSRQTDTLNVRICRQGCRTQIYPAVKPNLHLLTLKSCQLEIISLFNGVCEKKWDFGVSVDKMSDNVDGWDSTQPTTHVFTSVFSPVLPLTVTMFTALCFFIQQSHELRTIQRCNRASMVAGWALLSLFFSPHLFQKHAVWWHCVCFKNRCWSQGWYLIVKLRLHFQTSCLYYLRSLLLPNCRGNPGHGLCSPICAPPLLQTAREETWRRVLCCLMMRWTGLPHSQQGFQPAEEFLELNLACLTAHHHQPLTLCFWSGCGRLVWSQ